MWSVVQYRRIGKQVEEEWQNSNGEHGGNRNDPWGIELTKLPSPPPFKNMNTISDCPAQHDSSRSKAVGLDDRHVVVDIQRDDDPIDPRNWPLTARCKNIGILSLLIFVQAWAGAADSMANTEISEAFGVSKVAENLSQAMYLFGIGSGSLFMGPLSETFGRNPTYLLFTFCYLFFVLGSALTSTFCGQLVCRYFVGVFASATLAINGASVGDQFRPVKRTFVFPVIAWANVAGTKPKMCSILEYMLTLNWSPYDGTDCGRLDRVKSSS
jgi:DHA1 family multidrug resistance protein-like MFS transporter